MAIYCKENWNYCDLCKKKVLSKVIDLDGEEKRACHKCIEDKLIKLEVI